MYFLRQCKISKGMSTTLYHLKWLFNQKICIPKKSPTHLRENLWKLKCREKTIFLTSNLRRKDHNHKIYIYVLLKELFCSLWRQKIRRQVKRRLVKKTEREANLAKMEKKESETIKAAQRRSMCHCQPPQTFKMYLYKLGNIVIKIDKYICPTLQ